MAYVEEVVLEDFRAIAASRVRFVHPDAADVEALELKNMTLIVGVNGSGKSSVLKAIAAAYLDSTGGALPDSATGWPRKGGPGIARVEVRLSSSSRESAFGPPVNVRIPDREEPQPGERLPADWGLFAAYASARLLGEDLGLSGQSRAELDPHLLFPSTGLAPIEQWLPNSRRLTEIAALLNGLLPGDVRCLTYPDADGYLFAQRDIALPVDALSDGIQSFLAWMGDLLRRLETAEGSIADAEGIVLVDEIDQRMHPKWQQSVLTRLGTALPRLQFICTAHSPLLPSGLQRENLLLVEPDPDIPGATRAHRLRVEDVYGRTADQVLESSYFALTSTRSEPFWQELRHIALRAQAREGGRDAALEFMQRLAEAGRSQQDRP